MKKFLWALPLCAALLAMGCPEPAEDPPPEPRTGNSIIAFKVGDAEGAIDQGARTITVELPARQTDFTVSVTVDDGASCVLKQAENNGGVSVYTVTAENGAQKDYTVYAVRSGSSVLVFDAAAGILKQAGPITLSQSAKGEAGVKTADDWDSYLWVLDGREELGSENALTLYAERLGKGRHKLALIVTKNNIPYSSQPITITVTD
ncbi:MAG: hypothetical protein LBD37_04725 [Treponema sp.]|jgi:hypothetical protein|nr:hypothetical protein [Treponema sp.]